MSIQVHQSAVVDEGASIGNGVKIWHFSHICSQAKIGDDTSIGQNVFVADNVSIGARCKIQNNVSLYDGVVIEDEVFCGPSMVFTNVNNPRAFIDRKSEYKKTLVKHGATLGANCTILCGCTIGEYALIGAGAFVNKNVKNFSLMVEFLQDKLDG